MAWTKRGPAQAATRQFAKRQLTWFRHRMADWRWLEPCEQFYYRNIHFRRMKLLDGDSGIP